MAIVLGIAGCSSHAAQQPREELPLLTAPATPPEWSTEPSEPPPAGQPAATPSRPDPVNIQEAVRQVAKSAIAAAVVVDRQSHAALVSENADRQFAAGSLVKLLIGLDALHRHPGDVAVRRKVSTMIQYSDDPLANGFWMSEGGPTIVKRMAELIGLRSTLPPQPATRWGNTLVTANDLVRIFDYIMDKAPELDRRVILDAMASAASTGSDGFKQHFGIPDGMGELQWAVKQAWATNSANRKVTHSTGFVGPGWRFEVVLLTEHPAGQSWDVATKSVTAAARVLAPQLR